MTQIIIFYHPEDLQRVPKNQALNVLKETGKFSVFLQFIDPKTDCLVQDSFTFYPKEQVTSSGHCFIAEYNGIALKIPCDMDWWCRNAKSGVANVPQKTAIYQQGEYVDVEFSLEVSTQIRLA